MSVRLFGCQKFRRLVHEREDRDLSRKEEMFISRHRAVCPECRAVEATSSMALNMLRAAALDAEPAPMFEERVIRRWRVQSVRESLGYWSPAIAGAGIACIAIFASLALIGKPAQVKKSNLPASEARMIDPQRVYPDLDLRNLPRYNR